MTPTAFKPQNFYDSSLCEVLDRLCRASGIVDVCWNYETKRQSDQTHPWFVVDSRVARRDDPPDGEGPLAEYLKRRKTEDQIAADTARSERKKSFYASLRPLFLALEEGAIVAGGFIKAGKHQAVQMTFCDAARWQGNWTITRRADTAEVSFFIDIESEEAAATLTAVRLSAPAQVHRGAEPPGDFEAGDGIAPGNILKSKYFRYVPDVDFIMHQEHPPSLTEACRQVLRRGVGRDDDINNRAKRLRDVYKEAKGKRGGQSISGKSWKNAEIP